MNREILFRAWDSFTKKISEVQNLRLPHREDLAPGIILMQYTGLKDKNGVKIFEGDIVKYLTSGEKLSPDTHTGVITWNLDYGRWEPTIEDTPIMGNCKILGNIYQNPELLK